MERLPRGSVSALRPSHEWLAGAKQITMTQRDNFVGGFFLGTLVGGAIGGILGALVATRQKTDAEPDTATNGAGNSLEGQPIRRRILQAPNGHLDDMEMARRSLEDKIAQLNDAIDDVRHQLGNVKNKPDVVGDRPLPKDL